jgi:hypothetical protein
MSRPPSSVWIFVVVVPIILACSGLPVPGAISGGGDPVVDEADADPEEPDEGTDGATDGPEAPDEPETPPASADTLFPDLDANEAPPYERGAVKCPPPTMVIRHPKAGVLTVFCATGSGVRSGPYTEWQRNTLVVAATNAEGKFEGNWTRWAKGAGDVVKKVEQQVYVAGVATGDHAEWDVEGRLLVRGKMVDGKKDGRFIERKVEDGEIVAGGACYEAGNEVWRTSDDAELVSKACGTDAVAEG